jgi:outer membrane protein assembly factor BamB
MPRFFVALLATLALSSVANLLLAEDWTRFRGPHGSAVSDEKNLPTEWGPGKNIAWRTELPGPGSSSPIVSGDRIFLTCYRGYGTPDSRGQSQNDLERLLVCVNRIDGKILWQAAVKATLPEDSYSGFITQHGYATSTPATDGERVYAFFGKTGVLAFDMDGKQLWQTSVGTGSAPMGWGTGTSVLLYKDTVIVNASAESQAIYALDKETGKEVWKSPSPAFSGTWSTPILVDDADGGQDLVVSVPYEIWGFNPDTGKLRWYAEGISERTICPSVVAQDGILYAIGGRGGSCVALKSGGRKDVTATNVLWRASEGSYVPSPVVAGDYLYWASDSGIMFCLNKKDGKTVYKERLPSGGKSYASATAADGKLYLVTRDNGTVVVAAGPEFKVLAHNKLDDDAGTCNASPVPSHGQLLVRSNKYLYCIGE